MCKWEMIREVSRDGVWEVLSGWSFLGFMSEVVLFVGEGVGCACAAHDYGDNVLMGTMPV
jgi:hypothetical protein